MSPLLGQVVTSSEFPGAGGAYWPVYGQIWNPALPPCPSHCLALASHFTQSQDPFPLQNGESTSDLLTTVALVHRWHRAASVVQMVALRGQLEDTSQKDLVLV